MDPSEIEYAESLPSFEEYIYAKDIAEIEEEWLLIDSLMEAGLIMDSLDLIYYPEYLKHLADERERERKWRETLPLEYFVDSLFVHGADIHSGYWD